MLQKCENIFGWRVRSSRLLRMLNTNEGIVSTKRVPHVQTRTGNGKWNNWWISMVNVLNILIRVRLLQVVFTERIRPFRRIRREYNLYNGKYHISFENSYVQEAFDSLLQHICRKCQKIFHTYEGLDDHMRKAHDHYYCDLCVKHLKVSILRPLNEYAH